MITEQVLRGGMRTGGSMNGGGGITVAGYGFAVAGSLVKIGNLQ